MLKRLVGPLLMLVMAFGLAACDSLPKAEKQKAAKIETDIVELYKTLETSRADYVKVQGDQEAWAFFAPYAEREDWAGTFDQVSDDLSGLRARYDREVKPLLEANKSDDGPKLTQLLTGIEGNFKPLKDSMHLVKDRMTLLKSGYDNAPTWIADSRKFVADIDSTVSAVAPAMKEAKQAFPERAADIDQRFAAGADGEDGYQGLGKLQSDAVAALKVAEAEFSTHEAGGEADYAAFADAVELIKSNAATVTLTDPLYREDLQSLFEEYTTILRDMKVEYSVIIGRTSWDENADFGRENDVLYPEMRVSQEVYEYLVSLPQGEGQGSQGYLARYASGFGSYKSTVFIDQKVWDVLNVDMGASWTRGHNNSMFWIEDAEPIYYHKYAEVSGTTVTEGEWEELDTAEEYGANIDDFGMAISSKKLGQFANEAVEEATPPGMDMVGDDRYGEWREDSSGNTFWHWYGQYMFFSTLFGPDPYYYSRNDYNSYNSWRNDRRSSAGTYGWYGQDRTKPVYGSSGSRTVQTASYKSSPFAKAGGANNRSTSTLRQAGASARSRGPGGKGK